MCKKSIFFTHTLVLCVLNKTRSFVGCFGQTLRKRLTPPFKKGTTLDAKKKKKEKKKKKNGDFTDDDDDDDAGARWGETAVAVSSVSSSSDGISRHHNHHHNPREESAREIVRRKRETFLAQMAVDVRKEEIDKLEKRAAQREEALRNAERMLEEDKKRFDLFLKENDERVREATRRAEKEAKKKREKANEVKRLNDEIATARLDLGAESDVGGVRGVLEVSGRFDAERVVDGV